VSVWLSPLMISVRNCKESTEVAAGSALSISVRIPTTQTQHLKYYYKRNWMSRQIIGLYFLTSAAFDISMPKYIQGNWWPNNTVIQEVYCCFVKLDSQYRVFQKDLNIFYSGHRGHRTWHSVIFSYGDTLKTMLTNHKLQDRIRAAVQTIEGGQVS
jgi:hypothetical protein